MDRLEHLHVLRGALEGAALDLPTPGAPVGERERSRALRRLGDHLIPRLADAEAPLLAVIGGSTGAGKSTVLNSLVGARVSASSAIRPTTRRPLLVHRAPDAGWFQAQRILPGLPRERVEPGASASEPLAGGTPALEVREVGTLPRGMALLDAPDLDSVVEGNRSLARQLLDAADLWVFVTTAARYADAVPWEVLGQAAQRDIAVAVVLNRVPTGTMDEVAADLHRLMTVHGIGDAPLVGIEEQPLVGGLLPAEAVGPLRAWLEGLGADFHTRAEVARRTLAGSVRQVVAGVHVVEDALGEHDAALRTAGTHLEEAVEASLERLAVSTGDGTLLRGEVLARWQEVIGAADFTRRLGQGVSHLRDRLTAALRGKPAPVAPVEDALEAGLASLLREEFSRVREDAEATWVREPATVALVRAAAPADPTELDRRSVEITRGWQAELLVLVRTQGGSRRTTARVLAVGTNLVGVSLMVVIFASTGGLTGAEVGVAGATAAVAQKLLEVVFGDQAVRTLATRARAMLLERARTALEEEVSPLRDALPPASDRAVLARARGDVESDWGLR